MKILHDTINLEQFFETVAQSPTPVLLLDYDGTLAPFTPERDKAFPYPGVTDILSAINLKTRTRLVIISGRSIHDLLPLLRLDPAPEIWGSHGLERKLPDGSIRTQPLNDKQQEGLRFLQEWCLQQHLQQFTEHKPGGIAFHWRGTQEKTADSLKALVYNNWANKLDKYGLTIKEFDGGVEIRLAGISKADAVNEILDDTDPGTAIAFLGDDLTDEDAFRVLQQSGLSILVRPELRETLADIWLIPPDELLAFLKRWYNKSLYKQ